MSAAYRPNAVIEVPGGIGVACIPVPPVVARYEHRLKFGLPEPKGTNVHFDYSMGDLVRLVDIQATGRITGLRVTEQGSAYLTVWWHDGARHEDWVTAAELEAKK